MANEKQPRKPARSFDSFEGQAVDASKVTGGKRPAQPASLRRNVTKGNIDPQTAKN